MLIEPIEIAVTTIKIQLWGLVFARLSFPLPLEQALTAAAGTVGLAPMLPG